MIVFSSPKSEQHQCNANQALSFWKWTPEGKEGTAKLDKVIWQSWDWDAALSVEWYNVRSHSWMREEDPNIAKIKGSIDLDLILEMRDDFDDFQKGPVKMKFSRI